MVRMVQAGLLVLVLGGCAAPADGGWWRALAGPAPDPGAFRFDWHIAGDPALAPLQVFDDGRQTWLQYPEEQPAPALFERRPQGDRLLRPQRQGDYLVIQGVPRHLVLRGGHLQAEVRLEPDASDAPAGPVTAAAAAVSTAVAAPAAAAPAVAPAHAAAMPTVLPADAPAAPPALSSAARPGGPFVAPVAPDRTVPLPPEPARAVPTAVAARVAPLFEATPADGNIRRALGRWARTAGWVFEAEHWAVDVDIPLAGSAAFGQEFRPAVRHLLAATELGDRPLQPCFYANRVLRVIPLAQRCDRTQAPGALS